MPYTLALANHGYRDALIADPHLLEGLNVHRGALTNAPAAKALGKEHTDAMTAING